jgi:hypothetical protein
VYDTAQSGSGLQKKGPACHGDLRHPASPPRLIPQCPLSDVLAFFDLFCPLFSPPLPSPPLLSSNLYFSRFLIPSFEYPAPHLFLSRNIHHEDTLATTDRQRFQAKHHVARTVANPQAVTLIWQPPARHHPMTPWAS